MPQTLEFPASTNTVRVRMIDTTGVMVADAKPLVRPSQIGHQFMNIFVAAFLVEHVPSGRKVMFDLGIRKDYWNLPAVLQKRLGDVIPSLCVEKDVTEILQENGVLLTDISSIIWSHYHWDHIGNTALFPGTTELVVGPGFTTAPNILPGFPDNINSPVDASVFNGRSLREVDFSQAKMLIGDYPAYDFFQDGSFYLLDTPGHCVGHMCGLARTSHDPESTFLLLGGDVCHFPGAFRPSLKAPLPDPIPEGVLDQDGYFPNACPCSIFTDNHPRKTLDCTDARTTPFYLVSIDETSAYIHPEAAQRSVNRLISFDVHPDVMVCLAHDETLLKTLPTLNNNPNDDLNSWKSRGYKDKVRWGWLNDMPRNGQAGRKFAIEGFWRNGMPWPGAKNELQKKGEKILSTRRLSIELV